MKKTSSGPQQEANQTVPLQIDTKDGTSSIRISFTDQRLTAHGGMVIWSHHLRQKGIREQLRDVLPHAPTSPNSYDPTDVALGYIGGIICGADKLSRVAWLQSDPAIAEVLGVEAVASQSTFSRFFARFKQNDCNLLNQLHRKPIHALPSHREGYTLDMDSWSLQQEGGHQEGGAGGLHPARKQTVSSCPCRRVGRGQRDCRVCAAPWGQPLRERGG